MSTCDHSSGCSWSGKPKSIPINRSTKPHTNRANSATHFNLNRSTCICFYLIAYCILARPKKAVAKLYKSLRGTNADAAEVIATGKGVCTSEMSGYCAHVSCTLNLRRDVWQPNSKRIRECLHGNTKPVFQNSFRVRNLMLHLLIRRFGQLWMSDCMRTDLPARAQELVNLVGCHNGKRASRARRLPRKIFRNQKYGALKTVFLHDWKCGTVHTFITIVKGQHKFFQGGGTLSLQCANKIVKRNAPITQRIKQKHLASKPTQFHKKPGTLLYPGAADSNLMIRQNRHSEHRAGNLPRLHQFDVRIRRFFPGEIRQDPRPRALPHCGSKRRVGSKL